MFLRWLMLAWCGVLPINVWSQTPPRGSDSRIVNGGMEDWTDAGTPSGWHFIGQGGGTIAIETDHVLSGKSAAKIDSTAAGGATAALFSNLMTTIDAVPYRGKKVRYRGAVRTDDLNRSARVQMWLRVDRAAEEAGQTVIGAFDNMQDRPIDAADWEHFEIVLPVAQDAEKLALGVFVIGKGRAWFDDADLAIVDDDTPSTATESQALRSPSLPPAVARAFATAAQAPRQPFYSHWLWLALLATVMSLVAMYPLRLTDHAEGPPRGRYPIRHYCLRFASIYWGLYCFPNLAAPIIPWLGTHLASLYSHANTWLVTWLAADVFHLQRELVPPNGSGDTTYNYLSILAIFVIAAAGGLLWSLLDRSPTRDRAIQDLLRSYLRYAIALAMIGYGLAKVSLEMNQFPENTPYQLDKTWGNSSPMNVLWAFMGASRPYTIFAGLGETLAAVLLVWRRTAVLGAIVAFGVMTNVMMLNYCYDVPVKIYSTHLVIMSLLVMAPDARRLIDFFVLNRATAPADLVGIWGGGVWRTIHWVAKLAVIVLCIGLPLTVQGWELSRQLAARASAKKSTPPSESDYLLLSRGFRWINEVPFNR